jgi:hypothetical protein
MKRKLLFSFAILGIMSLVAPLCSSCSSDEESTDVYYITVDNADANFTSNLLLQLKVTELIGTGNKLTTESEAKTWFNGVCDKVADPKNTADIALLTTTFDLVLGVASSSPDTEGKIVATKTITIVR